MKELLETEPAAETVPTAAPIQLEHLTARQLVQAARAFYQREDLTELEREQVMYAVQHFFWDAKNDPADFLISWMNKKKLPGGDEFRSGSFCVVQIMN